jgi:hypothetical protein
VIGLARGWLWLVPGLFLSAISLYGTLSGNAAPRIDSGVVIVAIVGGLLLAALGEYHRVRVDRDELAAKAKIALNKHLSEGHVLRKNLLDKSRTVENPVVQTASWVLMAEVLVRDHAPGYYRRWEFSIPSDKGAGEVFLAGIATLDGICREIGVE